MAMECRAIILAVFCTCLLLVPMATEVENSMYMCRFQKLCQLICNNGSQSDINRAILLTYTQLNKCYSDITLIVSHSVRFENDAVPARWLQPPPSLNLTVKTLFMDLHAVQHIAADAFDTPPFQSTQVMRLMNLHDGVRFDAGAFAALSALRHFELRYLYALQVPDLLGSMGATGCVQQLSISDDRPSADAFDLFELTASSYAYTVTVLTVTANLRRTLRSDTLRGLTAVEVINLRDCNLDTIPPNVFQAMGRTLRALYLEGNELQTVPVGLFSAMVSKAGLVEIHLERNNWNCQCGLRHLQKNMRQYPMHYRGNIVCDSPPLLHGTRVTDGEFCQTNGQDTNDYQPVACEFGKASLRVTKRRVAFRVAVNIRDSTLSTMFSDYPIYNPYVSIDVYVLNGTLIVKCIMLVDLDKTKIQPVPCVLQNRPFLICISDSVTYIPLHCVSMVGRLKQRNNFATYQRFLLAVGTGGMLSMVAFISGAIITVAIYKSVS